MLWCHDFQFISFNFHHTSIQTNSQVHTHTHRHSHICKKKPQLPTVSINSLKHCVRRGGGRSPPVSQYSQRVALSRESALAFSPPAWSPLRYFPPTAKMAILLRSQNSNRNWTGVELLHTTDVSSPTHQYFPWESGQTAHTFMEHHSHAMQTAPGVIFTYSERRFM